MSSHVYMVPSIVADLHTCHIYTKSYIYVKYILIQPCGFTYMSHICYIYVTPSCSTKLYSNKMFRQVFSWFLLFSDNVFSIRYI